MRETKDMAGTETRKRRILLYSHDSFGLGHLRRSLSIATEIAARDRDAQMLLVTGAPFPCLFDLPPRVEILKLPSITKDETGAYVPRRFDLPVREVVAQRSAILGGAVRSFRPDALLVDHTPTGLLGELRPVLEEARTRNPETVLLLGLRDLIDAPEEARRQLESDGSFDLMRNVYDEIFVYGDPRVFDVARAYGMHGDLNGKLRYLGFVCPPGVPHAITDRRAGPMRILASAGGGEDGFGLLSQVALALLGPMRDERIEALLVTGPLMDPAEVTALRRLVAEDPRITVQERVRSLIPAIREADLVVSMGGYNSVYETLRYGRRVLVFPRVHPRREQWERGKRLAEMGLVRVLSPTADQTGRRMGEAIREALSGPEVHGKLHLPFDGAALAADRILSRLAGEPETCPGEHAGRRVRRAPGL